MPSLLYLSYGTGLHELEVEYSIATAIYQAKRNREKPPRILVLTDHPENFSGSTAEIVHITSETWTDWGGRTNFNHRRKIMALRYVMDRDAEQTVLLDGDTWFQKSPSELLKRISPQTTLLHANEGTIDNMSGPKADALKSFLGTLSGLNNPNNLPLPSPHSRMWNAGVIGLHPAHRPLLDQVLALTDFFCQHSSLHILEQLAFSHVLPRTSQTTECLDIVFHYWPPYLHKPFRERIESLLRNTSGLGEQERLEILYRNRPSPTHLRRAVVVAKRVLELLHLKTKSVRSNEW